MTTKRFQGKCGVILGGTDGIGLATAQVITDGGAEVIVTGRSLESIQKAREVLGEHGTVIKSDITSQSDLSKLSDTIGERSGEVDFLFINAGMTNMLSFDRVTEDEYDRLFALDTRAPFFRRAEALSTNQRWRRYCFYDI